MNIINININMTNIINLISKVISKDITKDPSSTLLQNNTSTRCYYLKGRNDCEILFCGRNSCGIYFGDLRPQSQNFLSQKFSKLVNRKSSSPKPS